MSDYLDALADFAVDTKYSDVPPHVIEHAKLAKGFRDIPNLDH